MSPLDRLLQNVLTIYSGRKIAIHLFKAEEVVNSELLQHLISMGHCPRFNPPQMPVSHGDKNYIVFVYDLTDLVNCAYYCDFCFSIGLDTQYLRLVVEA
jgi:hypothetical protein